MGRGRRGQTEADASQHLACNAGRGVCKRVLQCCLPPPQPPLPRAGAGQAARHATPANGTLPSCPAHRFWFTLILRCQRRQTLVGAYM